MAIGKTNVSFSRATLVISCDEDSKVSIASDAGILVVPAIVSGNKYIFPKVKAGIYTVSASKNRKTVTKQVTVPRIGTVTETILFPLRPSDFICEQGKYFVCDDNFNGAAYNDWPNMENWMILLYGNQNVSSLFSGKIDVWGIGGGASSAQFKDFCSAGNGGTPAQKDSVEIAKGTAYPVVIGAGGIARVSGQYENGGDTTGFGLTAPGGVGGTSTGHGENAAYPKYGAFGSDNKRYGGIPIGKYSTNEEHFSDNRSGSPNTGAGSHGAYYYGNANGGSGIMIIRNAR